MSFVGEDEVRLEGKLQDSGPCTEGLHEAEQNSKNYVGQDRATQAELRARNRCNKQLTQFFFHRIHYHKGEKNPNKISQNTLKYRFSRQYTLPTMLLPATTMQSFNWETTVRHLQGKFQCRVSSAFYTVHLDALHFFLGRPTLKATRPPGFLGPAGWNLHGRDQLHLDLGF